MHNHTGTSIQVSSTKILFPSLNSDRQPQVFEPKDLEIASNEIDPPEWTVGSKFHFAMASSWHKDGKNAHIERVDKSKLLNWIKGCVSYTREQLIYIEK